jgi:hypothetical protein
MKGVIGLQNLCSSGDCTAWNLNSTTYSSTLHFVILSLPRFVTATNVLRFFILLAPE